MNHRPVRRATFAALLVAAALLCAAGAHAVTIYRCGASGNSFTDRPCADGQSFDADDSRSAAQRADALRVAAAERRLAAELQRERLLAAARTQTLAAGFRATPAVEPDPAAIAVAAQPKQRAAKRRPGNRVDDRPIDFVAYVPEARQTARR